MLWEDSGSAYIGMLGTMEGLRLCTHWDIGSYGRTKAGYTLGHWGLCEDSGSAYTGMLGVMGGLTLGLNWDLKAAVSENLLP